MSKKSIRLTAVVCLLGWATLSAGEVVGLSDRT